MFVLGWSTNEVKEQSIGISDAISKSCWYNMNKSVQESMVLIMMRAQRPLVITIGPFGPMSIDTAITIMKAAYSYVTLTLNMYKE
ncbi:odorant receptor Or2-like [Sitophilus oryzae]|uniref:Odorant receptor Or2-like n=1 Tax=Sitophilus oryzae TaxID=7048 RepID=A0A6J2X9B0_SITOR|nr:odorant receptor Or2-like [Sitophilus oryzae]